MATRGQHRASHQNAVGRVQTGRDFTKIDRDALSDTHRDPQHLAFTTRARQVPVLHGRPHRRPVDRGHRLAAEAAAALDIAQEIVPDQPPAVADQQLDSRLVGQQALRPRAKRARQVIEARSVSGAPSAASIMR